MVTVSGKTLEILYQRFLDNDPSGELAEVRQNIKEMIDEHIEGVREDPYTITDYAMMHGFYAGVVATLGVISEKCDSVFDLVTELSEDLQFAVNGICEITEDEL